VPPVSPRSRLGSAPTDSDALSINALYSRIDRALKGSLPGQVWVSGEVRSFNVSSRGHCYMDLVDPAHAQDNGSPVLKVVCWSGRWGRVRSTLGQLGISLDAGLVVRVRGEVQLYKPRGDISFILSELDTDALLGKVAAERARLVKALVDENLFDRNRRLPAPLLPLRVGLVASPGTEGYRDFLGQLEGSGMAFEVRTVSTQVQGRTAAKSIARAIDRLQSASCDVLVVVRGGGSKADLATFDSELVARAIATSDVPVWTGIGHTGDQSVSDEVAHRTFITPTECGQELGRLVSEVWSSAISAGRQTGLLASQQLERTEHVLVRQRRGMTHGARTQIDRHSDRLTHRTHTLRGAVRGQLDNHGNLLVAKGGALGRSTERVLRSSEQELLRRASRLATLPQRQLVGEELRVAQWRRLLGAYDYQRQLDRGYSVTRDSSGSVVRSAATAEAGAILHTRLADGELVSVVSSTAPTAGTGGEGGDHGRPDNDRQHEEGTR
jgi:exodeoxyribonuclease VII large subunit